MLNINRTLLKETNDYLYKYNCKQNEIKQFLFHNGSFVNRQEEAIDIIGSIMKTHGKEKLLEYLVELARVEQLIRELEPWVRDHVVHAMLSFILGIYLNEQFIKPISSINIDAFQWKLAGLFHDVGYPAQIAKDILVPFTGKINEITREINVSSKDIIFKVVPVGLENLTDDVNSFDLIQKRLKNEWKLEIDVIGEYNQMIDSGNICHGMISSLAVLHIIDLLYKKYNPEREYSDIYGRNSNDINWNQECFDRDVISACSAIYIHNLPKRCFADAKIDRLKAPVAFLLKLSDCLQEWERPSKINPTGFSATQFDINLNNDQLIFHMDMSDDRKQKIKDEISSYLVAEDVHIY